MRTTKSALVTLLGIVLAAASVARAQPAPAEDKSSNPLIREYRTKLPLLVERYSTNRKIRIRITRYEVFPNQGKHVGDVEMTAIGELITDGKQIKAIFPEATPEKYKDIDQFWRPDMRFDIAKQNDNKYKLKNQDLASDNYYHNELRKYLFFAHEPMRAGGCNGTSLWFDDRIRNSVIITVVGAQSITRNGRACVEVRSQWDNKHGMVELATTYLDPANDYVTVATETDWTNDQINKKRRKLFEEIEYQPSGEGYPLPKASHRTAQYDDGVVRKVYDVEFLSYEWYTPAPEEFQLEGPYGLTTPAVVPTTDNKAYAPPPPARRWWPWAAVAAGVVLAVTAVLLYRRGRRSGTPVPPNPAVAK
jgi:hypothetical protein